MCRNRYCMAFMSCTSTVRVESPCHPLLLLAVTMKREAASTTERGISETRMSTDMYGTHAFATPGRRGVQGRS